MLPLSSSAPPAVKGVFFDLDGTLADTAPDLAYALNTLRKEQQLAPLPYARIRPVVSHGATALLRLGFAIDPEHVSHDYLRQRLLEIYSAHLTYKTRLFPGMAAVLQALEDQGIKWGVITNKPGWLTEPLVAGLGLAARAACIVSGDSTPHTKPHPEPLLQACRETGLEGAQCLYVGDARRDIEAGKSAGMKTLVALFGYIGADDAPESWQADGLIERPLDILSWIAP